MLWLEACTFVQVAKSLRLVYVHDPQPDCGVSHPDCLGRFQVKAIFVLNHYRSCLAASYVLLCAAPISSNSWDDTELQLTSVC